MNDTAALLLAAGKGTRMHSNLAKVLHPVCGRPMLSYSLVAVLELGLGRVLVVVGHQAERIQEMFAMAPVEWVIQAEQLGTAHAVRCALPHLVGVSGSVLICCGDTPLVTARTLRTFMQTHLAAGVDLSVLSMVLEYSTDYGRIVRDSKGRIVGIIEARDASEAELEIREVNTGIYCASAALLRKVIPLIDNANAQGEYYLTDLVGRALAHGWRVQAVAVADPREVMGVNSPEELAAVERLIAQRHTP